MSLIKHTVCRTNKRRRSLPTWVCWMGVMLWQGKEKSPIVHSTGFLDIKPQMERNFLGLRECLRNLMATTNRCPPHLSPSPLYWSSRSSSSTTTTGINCSCWCTGWRQRWRRPSYTVELGRFLKKQSHWKGVSQTNPGIYISLDHH